MRFHSVLYFPLLLCTGLHAGAQTAKGIKKTCAFYTAHFPGNIAVDPNGHSMPQAPDTLYTIYVETGAHPIQWQKAWKDGRTYAVVTVPVTEASVEAGIRKTDGRKMIITPAKGNTLWRLELSPAEQKTAPPQHLAPGCLLLQGKEGAKTIFHTISTQVELKAPDAV